MTLAATQTRRGARLLTTRIRLPSVSHTQDQLLLQDRGSPTIELTQLKHIGTRRRDELRGAGGNGRASGAATCYGGAKQPPKKKARRRKAAAARGDADDVLEFPALVAGIDEGS